MKGEFNDNDLISVLIPVFNVEKYLSACLDSIINQTYKNLEIIMVDDGSQDQSGRICDEYALNDKRMKVFHNNNEGQAFSRNFLLEVAAGDFFVFVDSDDIVSSTYIENLYYLTQKYNSKIACTMLQSFKDGEAINITNVNKEECCIDSLQAVEWMNYQIKLDTWPVCKIYHRSIFESKKLRYPLFKISEDLALTFVLLLESDKVAYSNITDYYYRLHNNSTDGKPFSKVQMDAAVEVINYMDSYQENIQPIIKSYICRKISFSFRMLLKMPKGYDNALFFEDIIKNNRRKVIFDSKARLKTRIACLVSYLGFNFVRKSFGLIDRRR